MKKHFTEEEFKKTKSTELLPCECYTCCNIFYLEKHKIQRALNPKQFAQGKYCSQKCMPVLQKTCINVSCLNCSKFFEKQINLNDDVSSKSTECKILTKTSIDINNKIF